MRLTVVLETGDPRYEWLNKAVIIASAAKSGNYGQSSSPISPLMQDAHRFNLPCGGIAGLLVVYDAYQVL